MFLASVLVIGNAQSGWAQTPRPPKDVEILEKLTPVSRSAGHKEKIFTVVFNPQGDWFASASSDKTIHIWDAATGKGIVSLQGHSFPVYGLAFSPDGKQVASAAGPWKSDAKASKAGEVKVWGAANGREIFSLRGHTDLVYRAAFSPDGKMLATSSADRTIKTWNLATGKELLTLRGHTASIYGAAFSPDGKTLVSVSGDFFQAQKAGEVKLWDAVSGQEIRSLQGHTGPVYSAAFTRDGKLLATCSGDKTIRLWDAVSGQALFTLQGHTGPVYSIAFSPDGKYLASASRDHTIRIWDLELRSLPATFQAEKEDVYSVAYSPDGKRLLSGGDDKEVKIWDLTPLIEARRKLPIALNPKELESLWIDLAGNDPLKAYAILWALAAIPDQATCFLHDRLLPATAADPRIAQLIVELDSDAYAVRAKASEELARLGDTAEPALRRALDHPASLEVRRRINLLLETLQQKPISSPDLLRVLRVIKLLEHFGTPAAGRELQALAKGNWGKQPMLAAQAALNRLTKQTDAKP
jgi:predicted NACHT family NTPase